MVYGGKALMAPVEIGGKRNVVTLSPSEVGGVFRFTGDLGTAWLENGEKKGDAIYFPVLDTALFVCRQLREAIPAVHAQLDFSDAPKGTGSSASIPVALSLALYAYFQHVPSRQELYDAAFVGDNAYHGGKSSGGDVAAVLSNQAQLFWRVFDNGVARPVFEAVDLHMPSGTVLLLVSSDRGAPKASTASQIEVFAHAHGVSKKPTDMSLDERKVVFTPFDAVVDKIQSFCRPDANPRALGAALDENHVLLESVSTAGITEAIATAKKAGALGGKLVGAGGQGGALIVLCQGREVEKVRDALQHSGFSSWPVQLARKGPSLDRVDA